MSSVQSETLLNRIAAVRAGLDQAAIASDRDPASVTIVAVSKTVGWSEMQTAYDAGLRHFGENRVLDARDKLPGDRPTDMTMHLIGQLQTNKASHAVDLFSIIESVDRPSLVTELEKQAVRRAITLPVLLQVNVAGEEQKAGCDVSTSADLARAIAASSALDLQGLMTIAPLVDDSEDVRSVFRALRELRDDLQQSLGLALPTLSMGMTNDYQIAIQEGATHIRVGRAIFG